MENIVIAAILFGIHLIMIVYAITTYKKYNDKLRAALTEFYEKEHEKKED